MRGTLYLVNRAHPLAGEPEADALVPVDGGHPRIMLHQRARVMLEQLLTAVGGRGPGPGPCWTSCWPPWTAGGPSCR